MNPNYGGFKADAGQPIKHGHPRQSAYHLIPLRTSIFLTINDTLLHFMILYATILAQFHIGAQAL